MDSDSNATNSDAESASPETNYFKMMMEDNQTGRVNDGTDDSILGGQTLASVINNNNNNNNNSSSGNNTTTTTGTNPGDSSRATRSSAQQQQQQQQQQHPGETLAIVGVEDGDDVSTLANDTVNDATKAFFVGRGSRKDSKPRIRLFQEYSTPEKKKKKSRGDGDDNDNNNNNGSDEDTVPETPPGMIRVPAGGRSASSSHKKGQPGGSSSSSEGKPSVIRSKRVFVIAGALALILFVSIIALSVALKGMRNGDDDGTSSASAANAGPPNNNDGIEANILELWPDLDATPIAPDKDKGGNSPVDQGEDNGNGGPAPTLTPTFDSKRADQFKFDLTLDFLTNSGAISSAKDVQKNPESPQYRATTWLSQDPEYYNYSEERLVQRWALANLAYSLDLSSAPVAPNSERVRRSLNSVRQRRRTQDKAGSDVLRGWLRYTDECTWFTSSATKSPCDNKGLYTTIDIRDMMLGGTLPAELSLLADSLKHIILEGNELVGSIPEEFEDLSNLVTLRLGRNSLEGDLSMDLGELTNLKILDLGNNTLTGVIPYSVVNMFSLAEIHLGYNSFSGEIPMEIGNLNSLTKLALNDNNLSGWVPDGLTNLRNLQVLKLGNNDLSGELPRDVCRFRNLEVLSLDCEAQGCECCTECASTSAPTLSPTESPTTSPSESPVRATAQPVVTDSPTDAPTRTATGSPIGVPSASPTECVNEIIVSNTCFAPSVDIMVSLLNCNPDRDDWVGLYPMDSMFDRNNLANPNIWSWACGTRNCREEAGSKEFALNTSHAGINQWPLSPGTYVAVIARNSAQPYTAFAMSDAFVVSETC